MDRIKRIGSETFMSLQIRNYRLYFISQAISLSGTWMQTVAQAWLVLKITGSGTSLGITAALQFLPVLLFGPWGGLIADRYNKRNILFVTQSAAALLALILGILVFIGHVNIYEVYVLALLLGVINVVDNPTRQTFVIEMVGKEHLTNAVSLNASEMNLARIIGPMIAGVLIASVGIPLCFIINALSYLAVIFGLHKMNIVELNPTQVVEKEKGQIIKGFKYVASDPILRNALFMMAIIGTLSYEFNVIIPLVAQYTFKGDALVFAELTAAMGIGSIVGGMFTANKKDVTVVNLVSVAFLFGIAILFASLAPNFALELAALFIVGFFSLCFTSFGNVILQLESKAEMRGRVMALWTVAFLGTTPIGGPIIGFIGEHISARWGLAVGGLAAVSASSVGFSLFHLNKRVEIVQTIEPEMI